MVSYLEKYNIHHDGNLHAKNNTFGTIWLDVEGPQYWSSDKSHNVAFIDSLIKAGEAKGLPIGVYSSESQWTPITGGWTGASHLPLWYPHCTCIAATVAALLDVLRLHKRAVVVGVPPNVCADDGALQHLDMRDDCALC